MVDLIIREKEGVPGIGWHPMILANFEDRYVLIKGQSFGYDVHAHMAPLFEWLNNLFKTPGLTVTMDFKINYFNTSYSRRFLELVRLLVHYQKDKAGKVIINWYYDENDEDMAEEAEDIFKDVDITYHLIAVAEGGLE